MNRWLSMLRRGGTWVLAAATCLPWPATAATRLYHIDRNSDAVTVIDPGSGARAEIALGTGIRATAVVIDPGGTFAYVTSSTGRLHRLDLATGVLRVALELPSEASVQFTGDGRFAYAVGACATLWVIETDTDRLVATLPLPYYAQLAMAGSRAYALDPHAGAVDVIDTTAHRIVGRLALGHPTWRLLARPDGTTLFVTHDDRVRVVDAASGEERASIAVNGGIRHFAVSPDGRVAWAAQDDTLTRIDLAAGRTTGSVRAGAAVRAIAFTPDGAVALVGTDGGLLLVDNGAATIRAAVSAAGVISPNAVSADGQRAYAGLAASGDRGAGLAVLDAASGALLHTVPLDTPPVHVTAAPMGGAYVVTESGLWLVGDSGGDATPLAVDTNPVALAAAPDGSRLYVSQSRARAVDVLDTASHEVVGRLGPFSEGDDRHRWPAAIAVSPDGASWWRCSTPPPSAGCPASRSSPRTRTAIGSGAPARLP
jgi:DNA-binding beta-propeller fold protein YncE